MTAQTRRMVIPKLGAALFGTMMSALFTPMPAMAHVATDHLEGALSYFVQAALVAGVVAFVSYMMFCFPGRVPAEKSMRSKRARPRRSRQKRRR